MEDKSTHFETLLELAEDFRKTSFKLIKLKLIDKTSEIISGLASKLILIILIALFFMILNVGIALWLGEKLGKSYYGFFIMAGIYAVLSVIIQIFSNRWIKKPVRNSIITQLLNNSDEK